MNLQPTIWVFTGVPGLWFFVFCHGSMPQDRGTMVNVPLVWSWLGGSRTTHLIYIDGSASCWSHGLDEAPVASIVFWFRVLKSGMNDRPMLAYSSTHVWWPFQVLTHTHLPKKCKVETQLSFPFGPVLTYMFFSPPLLTPFLANYAGTKPHPAIKRDPFFQE